MMLIIILFFSAEAVQHDNVRHAVVCKRRGFDSVVRYMSVVYDFAITSFMDLSSLPYTRTW